MGKNAYADYLKNKFRNSTVKIVFTKKLLSYLRALEIYYTIWALIPKNLTKV